MWARVSLIAISDMKPGKEEPVSLLSKNTAKTLLVRNAIDATTLSKETRQIQKQRNSEQRLFLKKREHMLQRQSSLRESSPNLRRKSDESNKQQRLLSASSFLSADDERPMKALSRSSTLSSLSSSSSLAVSLPDIFAASQWKTGTNRMSEVAKRHWKGEKKSVSQEESCPINDDWMELRQCRYLRQALN